jgi:hypothetical protein
MPSYGHTMSEREFFRTVIEIEILSDRPLEDGMSLENIHAAITEGGCSGSIKTIVDNEQVGGLAMAKLLQAQEGDPAFFSLTDDGEDVD